MRRYAGRIPDGETAYVILNKLNRHKRHDICQWCDGNAVELLFTPIYTSWAEPDRSPHRAVAPRRPDQQRPAKLRSRGLRR